MELETICQAAVENHGTNKLNQNSSQYNEMSRILHWAKDILYEQNNNAISLMEDTYSKDELPPLYIKQESEKDYTPEVALLYTDKTIYEHEEAFSNVVENGSNILRHGLPA